MNILYIKKFKSLNIGFPILTLFFLILFQLSYGQEYQTAKAQKGDGIYSLLKRNGIPVSELKNFIELNSKSLGKNNQLIVGRTYKLPLKVTKTETTKTNAKSNSNTNSNTNADTNTGKYVIHKMFGPKYQNVKIIDNQLKGAVYYLVSGHGGPDPGAVGKYSNHTLCEDEYAYDVTLRLALNLIQHGATVYMIIRDPNDGIRDDSFLKPDKDEVCYPNLKIPLSQIARLRQRKDAVNDLYIKHKGSFQRQVVIHVDSRSRGENIDVFFYYDERSNTGKKLATNLLQTFESKYRQHQPGRGYHGSVSDRNLFVIKYSYPPAVFIELGNINHTRDQQRFIMENNRQAVANWLFEGLVKDFGNNK